MSQQSATILKRLGSTGLARALDDCLDHARLVRLANGCGLSYPGMRTRSQKRDRIIRDLVKRSAREEATAKTIVRLLKKETAELGKEWARIPQDELSSRLRKDEFLTVDGHLGKALFLIATGKILPDDPEAMNRLVDRPDGDHPPPKSAAEPDDSAVASTKTSTGSARELARLRKKNEELLRKTHHQQTQLQKSRDSEKRLRRDLFERKGELAESRMLVERLRDEIDTLSSDRDAGRGVEGTALVKSTEALARTVRKLSSEQRKLAHAIRKIADDTQRADSGSAPDRLQPVLDEIQEMRKEVAALRRRERTSRNTDSQGLEALGSSIRALEAKIDAMRPPREPRRPRKGSRPRVGVYIDVQNMFYAARQLKGKLDFDALLEIAVRDRRLILVQAYVVESGEIDQSGFITMLQHRAIQVRRKTLQVRADGSMKGDWDMEMAFDILDDAPQLDVVVLVSGDGDFTSLVNRVKAIGPRVEVVGFPRNTAKSLVEAADQFHALDRKFMIRTAAAGSTSAKRRRATSS